LEVNEIGKPGARVLAEVLPSLTSLTKLKLNGNFINDEATQAIIRNAAPSSLTQISF
jgi:hypothetical protein